MNTPEATETKRGRLEKPHRGRRGREPGEDHGTVHKALHDIQYIRDLIDASQSFFISGWSGVVAGIITVTGAAVSAWIIAHPERWDAPPALWALWIVIGLLLGFSDIIFFAKSSRENARPVLSMLLAKIVSTEVVMTAEGLTLTFLFITIDAPEYIPGAWLLAYGSTLTALGLFIPGGVWVLGLATFFASIAAFVVPSGGLWCVGFAGAAMCLWGAAYLIRRGR